MSRIKVPYHKIQKNQRPLGKRPIEGVNSMKCIKIHTGKRFPPSSLGGKNSSHSL
jgi:hypothetical protein